MLTFSLSRASLNGRFGLAATGGSPEPFESDMVTTRADVLITMSVAKNLHVLIVEVVLEVLSQQVGRECSQS